MKLQFNQTVQDKNTGEYYMPNTTYEFDDARAKEFAVGVKSYPLQTEKPYRLASRCN